MYDKAIYDIINENLIDGELPEDFSLAAAMGEENEDYADGAFDGITLYHIGRSDVSEDSMTLIGRIFHEINEEDMDAAFYTLFRFLENNTALGSIEEFEGYILDNAASVAEALEILEGFNMHNVFNTAYHYAIADNTGKSVVVEYINNEMKVTDAKVVTNHYLTDNEAKPLPAETKSSMIRYKAAYDAGEAAGWNMTPEQVRDALKAAKAIRAEGDKNPIWSIWSAVFEPKAKKVTYYFREDYTKYAEVTFGN